MSINIILSSKLLDHKKKEKKRSTSPVCAKGYGKKKIIWIIYLSILKLLKAWNLYCGLVVAHLKVWFSVQFCSLARLKPEHLDDDTE